MTHDNHGQDSFEYEANVLALIETARRELPKDKNALENQLLVATGLTVQPSVEGGSDTTSVQSPSADVANVVNPLTGAQQSAVSAGLKVAITGSQATMTWATKSLIILATFGALLAGAIGLSSINESHNAEPKAVGLVGSYHGETSASPGEGINSRISNDDNNTLATSGNTTSSAQSGRITPISSVVAVPSASTSSLNDELTLIEQARQAQASGNSQRALQLVATYEKNYPKGRLSVEATVVKIEALWVSGQTAAATSLARAYLKNNPRSPYGQRLRGLIPALAKETP